MTNQENRQDDRQERVNNAEVWKRTATKATLALANFSASVDLVRPHVGLTQLTYNGASISGHVLGISPGNDNRLPPEEIQDSFVRGTDLVVTYAQTPERPFSFQVYWRALAPRPGTVLLETILSLQTELLESFPGVGIVSRVSAESALHVTSGEQIARDGVVLTADQPDGVLLRSGSADWSYAEETHADDRGGTRLERDPRGGYQIDRQLGGAFLEKGVIRRLRVCGLFVPAADDLVTAREMFAAFAREQPPLTV